MECVEGTLLRWGPTGQQPQPPGPASHSHLILAGGAQVLGQVMAGDELQLLQGALALEGRPAGQRAPARVGHPGGLWRAVQAVVVVSVQARWRRQPVQWRGGPSRPQQQVGVGGVQAGADGGLGGQCGAARG